MKRFIVLSCVLCFPLFSQAADNPVDVIKSNQYDKASCIQSKTDDCINARCQTSSERNCQDNCRQAAKARCEVATDE